MRNVSNLLAEFGLLASLLVAIASLVRVGLSEFLGIGTWFWGGTMASYGAPVAFAIVAHLTKPNQKNGGENHA